MTRVFGGVDLQSAAVNHAEVFIDAFAGRNEPMLRDVLAADVRFRGLTPHRSWEAHGLDEAVNILLGSWIEATDHVDAVVSREVRVIVDRITIDYRFRVRNDEGVFIFEQQGVIVPADDGRIADLSIVCTGFRPDSA